MIIGFFPFDRWTSVTPSQLWNHHPIAEYANGKGDEKQL
ncbi:hypothetical protein CHCC20335_3085 [Bacillus paralicheniformis]|nr:hypothetical protein CHCC20335_3085 [Bacillus paralicheniformis]